MGSPELLQVQLLRVQWVVQALRLYQLEVKVKELLIEEDRAVHWVKEGKEFQVLSLVEEVFQQSLGR